MTPLRTNKNIDGGMGQNVKPNQEVREPKGRRYEATEVKYSTSAPCDRLPHFYRFLENIFGKHKSGPGWQEKNRNSKKIRKKTPKMVTSPVKVANTQSRY